MMRREKSAIANIYVPVKRRATLKPETVQEIAQSILEVGQQAPILVRRDGDRLVRPRFASPRSVTDAHDRVIDVLGKFITKGISDLVIAFTFEFGSSKNRAS